MDDARAVALSLAGVGFVRDGRTILADVDWEVASSDRWIVLGANGCGKTTLMRIAALYEHPSSGTVDVLGHRLGRVDVRKLRALVGFVSSGFADLLRPQLTAVDVVKTARYGALEPWWHTYTDHDRAHAIDLLGRVGGAELAERTFGTLSSGERQRVQLARSLMTDPALVLLDEPTAGLDLGGREELVADLGKLAADPGTPATVLVTHHVEEIPAGFTHLLLLRDGQVLASGPLDDVLTEEALSDCFGVSLCLERRADRWWAWSR